MLRWFALYKYRYYVFKSMTSQQNQCHEQLARIGPSHPKHFVEQLSTDIVNGMMVQGDKSDQWFPAQEWQIDAVKKVLPEITEWWSWAFHVEGSNFSEPFNHKGWDYKIGWDSMPRVLVNTKTTMVRELWFPLPPPPHDGASKKQSEAYFSYK